ncbi:MAG: hypothetical protein J5528_01650 [Firmicutes bacterium]|nr:hypothetical protein [Bacillota bacterium]
MKVFIVFLALLIVFSMYLSYICDLDIYMQDQRLLKMLAEDCAEAGALTIDEKRERIDKDKADEAALEMLSSSGIFPYGTVSIESSSVTDDGRGFELCLVLQKDDWFRLPFINIGSMKRISEYVWE